MSECLDFHDLIPHYDRPHTFFFMAPSYWKIPGYRHDFEKQDFLDLAEILAKLKGGFVMTINDIPEIREILQRVHD